MVAQLVEPAGEETIMRRPMTVLVVVGLLGAMFMESGSGLARCGPPHLAAGCLRV